ncbi:hypothetical protein SDC9_108536 [bioreactor metagenome]|uniref:Zincin peptidase n=1 Tax=bioreactor metagenome TaxID=1076179 RepID=A0A645B9E7_9ZZZZ
MEDQLNARKDLPEGYRSAWTFNITHTKEIIWLNVLGVILFVLSLWAFTALTHLLRPGLFDSGVFFTTSNITQAALNLVVFLVAIVVMLVVHEGFHGLFFWIFSHSRPVFAFKIYYASASAPGWYFPRWQYILVGLAPLVFITLIGIACLAWLPASLILPTWLILVFNTSGAVGDLWVVGNLLRFPASTYILDSGDASEFFVKSV